MSENNVNEIKHSGTNPAEIHGEPDRAPRKRGPVRRILRWTAFGLAGLLGLVTVSAGGGLLFLRSDSGERWITASLNEAMSSLPSGLSGHVESFSGPLLGKAHIKGLILKDKRGEWLTAEGATVKIDWGTLPSAFTIAEISVDKPKMLRVPELEPAAEAVPESAPSPSPSPEELTAQLQHFLKSWPDWLPELRIDELAIRSAELTRNVTPLPFTVSLAASASAGRQGLEAGMSVTREDGGLPPDASNRKAFVKSSLSPELEFLLDARLSDLGFAAELFPAKLAEVPAIGFSLQGKAPLADWKASLNAAFRDAAKGNADDSVLAALAGSLGLRPLSKAPQAEVSLSADSGALAHQLWSMLGQKNGRFAVKLSSSAEAGDSVKAESSLDIQLTDMEWGSPLLSALLGPEVAAGTSASVTLGANGGVSAVLEKLFAQAAHVKADAAGKVQLAEQGLFTPESRADLKAFFSLDDAEHLSPYLSGDMKGSADISGPFTALSARLGLAGSRLDTPTLKLKDVDVFLHVPSADIARIAGAFSRQKTKGEPELMKGTIGASLFVNDQPVRLDAGMRIDAVKDGTSLALDGLDIAAGANTLSGTLSALLSAGTASPAKGTVAAMAGTALPELNGQLALSVSDWDSLSVLSGLALSGEALTGRIDLENRGRQTLRFESALPSFQLHTAGKNIDLAGAYASLQASDIWGHPVAELSAGLKGLKADKVQLGEVLLKAEGGVDSVKFAVQSRDGLESDIRAQWKPGEVFVEEFEARCQPVALGLPEGEAVGVRLESPVKLTYSGESVSLPAAKLHMMPSGSLDISGRLSPARMSGLLALEGLELGHYQHMLPQLPAGSISMHADMSGTPQAPEGKFKLNLKDIKIPGASLPAMDADLHGSLARTGKQRLLRAQVDVPQKTLDSLGITRFSFKSAVPFTSPAEGFSMPDMKAPLKAELSLAGQLEGIWKLVPAVDQRLSGLIDLDAEISGTASSPVISAHVAVEDGAFLDIMQGLELRGIKLNLDADKVGFSRKGAQKRVELALSAHDGRKGSIDIGGWIDPVTMELDIDGHIKDLFPLRRPDIKVLLNGELGVEGSAKSPIVRADITVDKGEVELASLPGGSIPVLPIWTPEEKNEKEEEPAVPGRLDVRVHIPNQFFVRGYGLDCEWGGRLRIDAPLDKPAVRGSLKAVRGSLDILGKNFKLAEGEIRFDGGWPVSPLLNIDMEYVASSITANILVGGTATAPKLSLTSQPELPQDEILSQIMFGQSSGSLSHAQALQLASGAASLAGFGSGGIMGLGRKILGVDVLKINSDNDGEDSDVSRTSLEMGTYVRDNIYVGIEQGMGRQAETGAVVEIELTPRLELQAKSSGSDTEVGLEWKRNY